MLVRLQDEIGRWVEEHALLLDWLVAVGLALLSALEVARTGPPAPLGFYFLPMTLALGFRRRFPVAAACLVVATASVLAQDRLAQAAFLGLLLAMYSAGAYANLRRAVIPLLAGVVLAPAAALISDQSGWRVAEALPETALWTIVPWGIGRFVRALRQRERTAEIRALTGERQREEKMRQAVAAERSRIANELHDVVAHGVSVMGVQAAGARAVFHADPARARQAMANIETISRQTLAEMRRLLGLVREMGTEEDLPPQPELAQLETLIEQVRRAGLTVDLAIEGERVSLAPGVELCAYRVVQEALTNVIKHSPASATRVCVRYRQNELELEVTSDRLGPSHSDGEGQGLIGMRERVSLYGGEFEAGTIAGGGFRIHALLPLDSFRR